MICYLIMTTIPPAVKPHKTEETTTETAKDDTFKIYWMALMIIYWWSYGYWLQLFPDIFPRFVTTIFTVLICILVLIQLVYKNFGTNLVMRIIILISYFLLLVLPTSSNVPNNQSMVIVILRFVLFVTEWILCCKASFVREEPSTGKLNTDQILFHYNNSVEKVITNSLWILFGCPFLLPLVVILYTILGYKISQSLKPKGIISTPPPENLLDNLDIETTTEIEQFIRVGDPEIGSNIEEAIDTQGTRIWRYYGEEQWIVYDKMYNMDGKKYKLNELGEIVEI